MMLHALEETNLVLIHAIAHAPTVVDLDGQDDLGSVVAGLWEVNRLIMGDSNRHRLCAVGDQVIGDSLQGSEGSPGAGARG
jgi:hypothetical protein